MLFELKAALQQGDKSIKWKQRGG